MDTVKLESLLHLDESVTLDFKCEQYRFARATEGHLEKSPIEEQMVTNKKTAVPYRAYNRVS